MQLPLPTFDFLLQNETDRCCGDGTDDEHHHDTFLITTITQEKIPPHHDNKLIIASSQPCLQGERGQTFVWNWTFGGLNG